MQLHLPNSANLQNITTLLNHMNLDNSEVLKFSMHAKWVAVHPVVLSMAAALGAMVQNKGGVVEGRASPVPTLNYLIRMGLFKHIGLDPGREIKEHEESGRFIPITQISSTDDLKKAIIDLVPLLHAPPAVADPIKYVFSEMVRNSIDIQIQKLAYLYVRNITRKVGRSQ